MQLARILALAGVLAATACSSAPREHTSSVEGTLTQASFPSAATTVIARNEAGASVRATVAPDGSFRLVLPKGHRYRLQVLRDSGELPIVFPRADGRLDSTFRVRGGSARVHLGNVRFLATAAGTAFRVAPTQAPASECVDGLLRGTTTACVDDDGKVECEGATADDGDNQSESTEGPDENVSSEQSMAIPDQDVPDEVGGCAEEDDEEDDDNEQEGQH